MVETNESRPRHMDLPELSYGKRGKYLEMMKHMENKNKPPTPRRHNQIRRSDIEIYMDLMNSIKSESVPTRIMYSTNLSWSSLNDRLEFLLRAGFITTTVTNGDDERRKEEFYLTDLGVTVLTHWTAAMDILYEAFSRVLKTP
jgi:predicted transcriptional regulator